MPSYVACRLILFLLPSGFTSLAAFLLTPRRTRDAPPARKHKAMPIYRRKIKKEPHPAGIWLFHLKECQSMKNSDTLFSIYYLQLSFSFCITNKHYQDPDFDYGLLSFILMVCGPDFSHHLRRQPSQNIVGATNGLTQSSFYKHSITYLERNVN